MNRSHYQDRMDRVDRIHRIHNVHRANRVVFNPAAVLDDLPVRDWRHFVRSDPFEDLNDREFMMHYRFTKEGIYRLVRELLPYLVDDQRRHCLTPMQQVLITRQNKPFSGLPNLPKDKINLSVLVFLFINELRG